MKLTDEVVNNISTSLKTKLQGKIQNLATELQDDSTFLLVSIGVDAKCDASLIEEVAVAIRDVVAPLVPPKTSEYSWMGVIKQNGAVIESVSSEMLY